MGTISFLIGDLLVAINLMTKSFLNLKNKARKENLSKKYHRAFGVYGIIQKNNKLLVIKKNGGPYINRFDLPGGSLEDGESLSSAIIREIEEETNVKPLELFQLGTCSFKYPWNYEKWRYNQHITVFYKINAFSGSNLEKVPQFMGQDSIGSKFMDIHDLSINNSSPLVLKAKQYIENDGNFSVDDVIYKSWEVLDKPNYF